MKKLICKMCKRDLTECAVAFKDVAELKHAHTVAHVQDLMRDMQLVCRVVAKGGKPISACTDLAKDIMLRVEVIEGGLF